LARRGLALSAGLLAMALSENAAATLPAALQRITLQAAMRFAAGRTAPSGPVSPQVAALTNGVLRSLRLGVVKPVAAVGLALGLIVLVIWLLLLRGGTGRLPDAAKEEPKAPPVAPREEGDEKKLQGDWKMDRAVFEGQPMPDVGIDNALWTFQGDKVIFRRDGQKAHFTYKLTPDQKPR